MEGNRAASSAENEKHKTHWSDDETRALLKVWEDHLSDLRKTKRNLKVYVAIAECLRAQGVEKSVKDIKSKMENLGNRYRNLSRKTTGQGAITWRFYKDISRFPGSLPMNDSSLTEETCGEDATVEIIIHSMEHGPLGEEDSQPPPAPPDECSHNTTSLYSPSSPYSTDDCWAQPQAEVNSQQNNQTSRRTTQKTLLAQLVTTNRQLCADLNESRKQELELRRMELDIVRESTATEKLLTDELVKYLAK
ncbi:uncharacterized protein LOC125940297 [Dermacentor silvarum]|uniref:uncharacterized protein LOC125940297 n=1 Tax=Dermacentor silvarum TaxID=543639 RepID=UPI002100B16B|nr:uncharacterized protein LOC125940297 [Dermacentor silvarum]